MQGDNLNILVEEKFHLLHDLLRHFAQNGALMIMRTGCSLLKESGKMYGAQTIVEEDIPYLKKDQILASDEGIDIDRVVCKQPTVIFGSTTNPITSQKQVHDDVFSSDSMEMSHENNEQETNLESLNDKSFVVIMKNEIFIYPYNSQRAPIALVK